MKNWLVCLLLLSQLGWANAITTQLNRDKIILGQTLEITYILQAEAANHSPDFSPLKKQFDLLGQTHSQQARLHSGKIQSQARWIIRLRPKALGKQVIPPIAFGPYKSSPLNLEVTQVLSQTESVKQASWTILKFRCDNKNPYVQSQVLLTVQLYLATHITNGEILPPYSPHATIERFGADARYQESYQGRMYTVLERKYSLHPQHSGTLTIQPPVFTGMISRGQGSFAMQSVRNSAQPIELTVKPIPNTYPQLATWLPSTSVKINDTWDNKIRTPTVGEPLVREVTLKAEGVASVQLPDLNFQAPPGINVYPQALEQYNFTDEKGITGFRRWRVTYIPTTAKAVEIPALNLPWWHTKKNRLNTEKLPARPLNITAKSIISDPKPTAIPAVESKPGRSLPVVLSLSLFTLSLFIFYVFYHSKTKAYQLKRACYTNNPQLAKQLLAQQQLPSYLLAPLNQSCYAKKPYLWDGKVFWRAYKQHKKAKQKHPKKHQPILPAL